MPAQLGQSMRFRRDCFLRSPEWQAVLADTPPWPLQALPPRGLSIRSQLLKALLELPSLIIYASTVENIEMHQTGWHAQADLMMHKAITLVNHVQKLLTVEVEPLFMSISTSARGKQKQHISYPDILSGILDCVANTALLTLDKILRSLSDARPQPSTLVGNGQSGQPPIAPAQFLTDQKVLDQWRQRAMTAFQFVQGESSLAAKPLEFGIRQFRSSAPGCPNSDLGKTR